MSRTLITENLEWEPTGDFNGQPANTRMKASIDWFGISMHVMAIAIEERGDFTVALNAALDRDLEYLFELYGDDTSKLETAELPVSGCEGMLYVIYIIPFGT